MFECWAVLPLYKRFTTRPICCHLWAYGNEPRPQTLNRHRVSQGVKYFILFVYNKLVQCHQGGLNQRHDTHPNISNDWRKCWWVQQTCSDISDPLLRTGHNTAQWSHSETLISIKWARNVWILALQLQNRVLSIKYKFLVSFWVSVQKKEQRGYSLNRKSSHILFSNLHQKQDI